MSKSALNSFEQSLKQLFGEHFSKNDHFVAGISGGLDSMVLMYDLHRLQISADIVHVNYGLRGEESDLDQELVEQLAFEWGFSCQSLRLRYDEEENGNLQLWARKERYRIFEEIRREVRGRAVITAHHQDDQVETILQKIFRGSAPETWKGMPVLSETGIFRPLLPFSRKQIRDYAESRAVPFRDDSSNRESKYARNFIRLIMDEQLKELFPGWKENVLNLQDFGKQNKELLSFVLDEITEGTSRINKRKLEAFSDHLQLALIKKLVEREGALKLSRGMLEELSKWKELQTGKSLQIKGDIKLTADRNYLTLQSEADAFHVKLAEGGISHEYFIDHIILSRSQFYHQPPALCLDYDKLSFPLELRNRRKGDRFSPLGMKGSKTIADLLTDQKIPPSEKEKTLVLSSADGTIYAVIFPEYSGKSKIGAIADHVKVSEQTENYLVIKSK